MFHNSFIMGTLNGECFAIHSIECIKLNFSEIKGRYTLRIIIIMLYIVFFFHLNKVHLVK